MSIRVAIADDHAIVLHGLKRLFDAEPDFEVVECCTNGEAAVETAKRGGLDVLLLDVKMRGMSGIDVLSALSAQGITCPTVLLTAAISDADALAGLRLGARGIVLKESPPDTLLECLRRVHRGEQWVDDDTRTRIDEFGRRDAQDGGARALTARESEIVRMIGQGLRNRAIAERLSISEGTVKIHLHNVYEKLGVDGRLELMLYAQRRGLL